jgi:hypothetical protein
MDMQPDSDTPMQPDSDAPMQPVSDVPIQPISDAPLPVQPEVVKIGSDKIAAACIAGALIPGLGHALLRKWDRALIFFACISSMLLIGLRLNGRLFDPDLHDIFSFATLKFLADAGLGLLYWLPWYWGQGKSDLTAYTYDYANVFIYVAGLLNMLVIVDVFDIGMGRKK